MTEPAHNPEPAGLDRALRALAAADRQVEVSERVQAAVMQAWDAKSPAIRRSRQRARILRAGLAALASSAAAFLVVALLNRGPSEVETTASADVPDQGLVLVADPFLEASATQVVRVRLPRRALVSLGIPVVEPDGGGSIDLEVLVGEDGVARAIRRAAPAAATQE